MNMIAGAAFTLRGALEKPLVYLLWGMPIFLVLLLTVAMLIMAF
jgi:cytochrome c-type biogenesis protein CcmH/NrfF